MTTTIPARLRGVLRPDGRTVILAMDHAVAHGPIRGLDRPAELIEQLIAAGADGVMTSYGVVKKYGNLIRPHVPIIMRIDGGGSILTSTWREYEDYRLLYQVEDAARMGASAVVIMHFMGAPVEMETLESMAEVAVECDRIGMPLLVEALPCPHPNIPNIFDPEKIALAARIAAEHGADFVKTTYSGSVESFRRIVDTATVPVVVLGGEHMADDRAVFALVQGAIEAGACGIAMGRNIWQAPNPAAVMRALAAIVHDGATVDAALELTRG